MRSINAQNLGHHYAAMESRGEARASEVALAEKGAEMTPDAQGIVFVLVWPVVCVMGLQLLLKVIPQ
jgi:hypothetical protein